MKRVAILGSTGSIGTQALDVIAQHPERLSVAGLAAKSNLGKLREQAAAFGADRIALFDECSEAPSGMQALIDLATHPDVDIVVVSVAGVIGLEPVVAAIQAGKHIALASKEVLVAAGEIVMPLIEKHGVALTPIDSEHSAIFQCLQGASRGSIKRLVLTASGGPFRGRKAQDLKGVSVSQALNHPTWNMGGKITIDSATLMNKGLEMIEAHWLFGTPIEDVDVVVHPQSIIHSLVEFQDGSCLGQLGWPNMRLPIQYALLWPERVSNELPPWSPLDSPNLTFEPVDEETFRCLPLAREAAKAGGTMPCAMNAANEEAANAFLRSEIGFLEIADRVESVMAMHEKIDPTLEALLEVDRWARVAFREAVRA